MRRWAWICVLFLLAAAAPAAGAQSSTQVLFGSLAGQHPVAAFQLPVQTSGQLTVSFHGDPSTGCAAQGICGYSGTAVFAPGSQGVIFVAKYGIHGRVAWQVELELPAGFANTLTAARVRRAGGGTCGDARQPGAALPGAVTGGEVTLGLIQPQGDLISTRCAGPLDADLAGHGPQIRLSVGQLLRGRRTIPLGGMWSFAAGGFAGTVESNLTMVLGKPMTQPLGSQPLKLFDGERQVTETLQLVRGSGSSSLALGGDPNTCQFLDSCGIQGTLTGTPAPSGATGTLVVLGPAKRPYVDFLAALGLSRRGNPRGLQVEGGLGWLTGGTLTAQLNQPGASCMSTAPLLGGLVRLSSSGRGLTASYSLAAAPRTRCPGPQLDLPQTLAQGSVPRAALAQPSFSLQLGGSGPLTDDGYVINQHTSLTFTLRRTGVSQKTFLVPAG